MTGKRRWVFLLLAALSALSAAACGAESERGPGEDSETHFLALCEGETCGDGLSCICGLCTVTCDPAQTCAERNASAVCRAADTISSASCAAEGLPSVCDVLCDRTSDCEGLGEGYSCLDGACRLAHCVFEGKGYAAGARFQAADGCNRCECQASGDVACTLVDCQQPTDGCTYEGTRYEVGEGFPAGDGCNACTCLAPGEVTCTERACEPATCEEGGVEYEDGEAMPSDDCNACVCSDGVKACNTAECSVCDLPFEVGMCAAAFSVYWFNAETGSCEPRIYGGCGGNENRFDTLEECAAACGGGSSPRRASCEVNGVVYEHGASKVPDPQSCNTCACQDGVVTACTELACPVPCEDGTTFGRDCAQCGPADECEVVRSGCLSECDSDQDCDSGLLCDQGVCGNLCG